MRCGKKRGLYSQRKEALPAAYCRSRVFLSGPSLGREVVDAEETPGQMGIQVVDDQSFCLFYNPRFPHRRLTPLSREAACMLALCYAYADRTHADAHRTTHHITHLYTTRSLARRKYARNAKWLEFLWCFRCKS